MGDSRCGATAAFSFPGFGCAARVVPCPRRRSATGSPSVSMRLLSKTLERDGANRVRCYSSEFAHWRSSMSRTRTFVAIELSKPIRDRLISLQESLATGASDVKWVDRENLHVTLLFLGEVDDRELPAVCRAVQEALAEQAAFSMTVAGAGCFPNPRRPHILWMGIGQGVQEVVAVHDRLEPPLLQLGCYRR